MPIKFIIQHFACIQRYVEKWWLIWLMSSKFQCQVYNITYHFLFMFPRSEYLTSVLQASQRTSKSIYYGYRAFWAFKAHFWNLTWLWLHIWTSTCGHLTPNWHYPCFRVYIFLDKGRAGATIKPTGRSPRVHGKVEHKNDQKGVQNWLKWQSLRAK